MGWTFYNSSGQQMRATADKAASVAEMEAGSSTTVYATPGRTHNHPGVAKAWGNCDGDANLNSPHYGVASVTRVSEGLYTWAWDTDMADVHYAISVQSDALETNNTSFNTQSITVGSANFSSYDGGKDVDTVDDEGHHVIIFGAQA